MIRIFSWNILYRKYEEKFNKDSEILKKYPDENKRILDIVDILFSLLYEDSIVCIQECSIDILLMIKNSIQNNYSLFFYHVRHKEYIVTIAPKKYKFYIETSVKNDTRCANGILSIRNNNIRIVNCHLIPSIFSEKDPLSIFDSLDLSVSTFIAGDFNEIYSKLSKKTSEKYKAFFYGRTYRNRCIDNIIIDNKTASDTLSISTHNIKTTNISDHNIICLIVIIDKK